jgi:hypothetical protein
MLSSQVIARPRDASGFVELRAGSPASYRNCAATVRAIVENSVRQRLGPEAGKRP